MAELSKKAINDLLQQLDALDVLEYIDYHPESMQRTGDLVQCWDPLSQNHTGRYLKVDLNTLEFESTPPKMPAQKGNLVELFARCRAVSVDEAARELAEEFGILITEGEEEDGASLYDQAAAHIAMAEKGGDSAARAVYEADKRLRHLLAENPTDVAALRLSHRLRLLEKNPLTLVGVTLDLMRAEMAVGNLDDAILAGRSHLEVSPGDLQVRAELAEALFTANKRQEAVEEWMQLADLAETAKQYAVALKAYRRVRQDGADIVDVYPILVNLLAERGEIEEAVKEIQRRVVELRADGKLAEAAEELRRAAEFEPENTGVLLLGIKLAAEAGLDEDGLERCIVDVEKLIDCDQLPLAAEALELLATKSGANEMVLALLISTHQMMGNEPKVVEAQLRLADWHHAQDNAPEAILLLESLAQSHPRHVAVLNKLAELLAGEGSVKEALQILGKVARIQLDANDREGAVNSLRAIADLDPNHIDAREAELNLLIKLNRHEECADRAVDFAGVLKARGEEVRLQRVLDRVRQHVPASVPLLQALAASYRRAGEADKAAAVDAAMVEALTADGGLEVAEGRIQKLLKQQPDNHRLMELLADMQLKGGRKKNAIRTLEKLAEKLGAGGASAELQATLRKLVELRPQDRALLARLSDVCTELGDEDGVVATAEQQLTLATAEKDSAGVLEFARLILETKPEHAPALEALFAAQQAAGNKEEALATGRRLLAVYQRGTASPQAVPLLRSLRGLAGDNEELAVALLGAVVRSGDEVALVAELATMAKELKGESEMYLRVLRKVSRDYPETAAIHRRLASIYEAAGRNDDMVAELQKLVETEEKAGHTSEAHRLYEELLAKAPESLSTRTSYVAFLRRLGENSEAGRHQLDVARQLHRKRKLDEAAAAYRDALALLPDSDEALRGYADLLRDLGQMEEANRRLRELAALFSRQMKTERAVATLNEILDREPNNHEVRRDLVRLRREEGSIDEALKELARLAESLHKEGDVEGAIATRREAISLQPENVTPRKQLIDMLRDAGREDEARQETLALAETLARTGLQKDALKLLDTVVTDDSTDLNARRARARLYDAMGREKEALDEYRKLQEALDQTEHMGLSAVSMNRHPNDDFDSGLEIMEEYDFDSYIVGSKNNFAFATAKAVAENPGSARNPLFLYSEVGLGKTHLLHAIANFMKQKNPKIRILYMSTEYFTSELIDAIQRNEVAQFRARHRKSDVMLLDDVQFLAGKERAQEEFFHIFNMLFQSRRQIVVTSDRPPKNITQLDARLRSRFGQGVIVDIQPPDAETRAAILKAEAERAGITVPPETLLVLAERISSNVRELKGALNQLLMQHEITQEPMTPAVAREIAEKYFGT